MATLQVIRKKAFDLCMPWKVIVDGQTVGEVLNGKDAEFIVETGTHRVQITSGNTAKTYAKIGAVSGGLLGQIRGKLIGKAAIKNNEKKQKNERELVFDTGCVVINCKPGAWDAVIVSVEKMG